MQKIYKAPYVGLLGLFVGFMTQPLGHAVYRLIEQGMGNTYPIGAAIAAVAGLIVIWTGLKKEELGATWRGMIGGWLVWIGLFEFSFRFFGDLYAVPPYQVEPGVPNGYAAAAQASMLQATLPLMLALFVIYGLFNLQTKCNLMRWLHRNLRFSPGMPTADNKRSFARITAMEVLFVTWFCYLFWLYAIYFGTQGPGVNVIMGLYVAWSIWALYLVYKCTKQVRVAPALRYGIAAGIVLWGSAEMPAHFGAYQEYWLKPFEFPVFNAICGISFLAGVLLVARRRRPDNVPT
ncbi:MAG: hypothetical protein KDI32_08125 [Pseudomonadales bacterium]|nr:hypothetical protein [Pseudomonadales bacterium]